MKTIIIALKLFTALTVLSGLIYPLAITILGQVVFPDKANGSFIEYNGRIVGSSLIGQKFTANKYFWPRPSATGYNPLPSGATNWGMTNSQFRDSVISRIAGLEKSDPEAKTIPADLLFASGSGLDPDISPEAAIFQIDRVAKARMLDIGQEKQLIKLVERLIKKPDFRLFGQARLNVLDLNMALDSQFSEIHP
jgi:potassium-transporting ATPase KdpC subunit